MPIDLFLVLLALACAVWCWRHVRADMRRLSNAGWIGLTAALVAVVAALVGSGTLLGAAMLLMVASPVVVLALVCFLLWNGIQMLRREGRSLGNLLSLLAGIGIAAMVALAFALLVVDGRLLPLGLWLALAGGWVAVVFFGYLAYSWLYQQCLGQRRPDYIVTLGSGLIGDRVPPLLARRIDTAIGLYRGELAAGRTPVLVMSGGKGSDEKVSEAQAMGDYALARGVDAAHLLLETRSATTEQNLRFTQQLVREDARLGADARGLAVTSNYHAMRAATLARKVGVQLDVVGAPTAGYFWPSAVLREFVAIVRSSWRWQLVAFVLTTLPLPVVLAIAMWG